MDFNQINKTAELSQNNSMSLMVFKMINAADPDYRSHPFFAVNIFKVKEVLNIEDYTLKKMPGSHGLLKGMIDVRKEYIPVYDLSRWLEYDDFELNRSVYIISEVNGNRIGLHVAHISGVVEKNWDEIVPSDNLTGKVVNQTQLDGELCLIIDIEKMVNEIYGVDLERMAQTETINSEKNRLVLFADDQKSMRVYLKQTLDNLGFDSIGFETGQGIIDYLETKGADKVFLILTDLEMPQVSGHTVIKYVKQGVFSELPVYVHSSMTVGDSKNQAMSMGADGFIGKVSTERLAKVLSEALERQSQPSSV